MPQLYTTIGIIHTCSHNFMFLLSYMFPKSLHIHLYFQICVGQAIAVKWVGSSIKESYYFFKYNFSTDQMWQFLLACDKILCWIKIDGDIVILHIFKWVQGKTHRQPSRKKNMPNTSSFYIIPMDVDTSLTQAFISPLMDGVYWTAILL